jgi:hypothetical protein
MPRSKASAIEETLKVIRRTRTPDQAQTLERTLHVYGYKIVALEPITKKTDADG